MTPFIPGVLGETDKFIEVADGHFITVKQTGEVQLKICDDNGKSLTATIYYVLFAPNLCDRLFFIIMLKNSRYTCLLKGVLHCLLQ